MTSGSQEDLFFQTLKGELYAEREILKDLLKMENRATDPKLKQALLSHRNETENHILQLEEIFASLGSFANVPSCNGEDGLAEKTKDQIDEIGEPEVIGAALTSLALAVEHYEIERDARSKEQRQQNHGGPHHGSLHVVRG